MKLRIASVSLVFGLLGVISVAHAQQATLVTQTATLNATPQVLCSSVNAVNVAANCVTATPASGQRIYVTAVCFDVLQDATGTAESDVSWQLTGTAGFASAANLWNYSGTTSAGNSQHWCDSNGGVLFASLPGTAITLTAPTAALHTAHNARVYGYIAQ